MYGKINETKVVSFEEQSKYAEEKYFDYEPKFKYDKEGNACGIVFDCVSVNPKAIYSNAIKYSEDKKSVYVVLDNRAISEKDSGRIYTKTLLAYVITKGVTGLKLLRTENITDIDFINNYNDILDAESMKDILICINKTNIDNASSQKLKLK